MTNFNCVECFLRTGEYPNFACGECGRYAAGEEMSNEDIDKKIEILYNDIVKYANNRVQELGGE